MKILAILTVCPEYIEFCLPELKSLFSMHGVNLKELFKYELPNYPEN
jgi:hypothetical protein